MTLPIIQVLTTIMGIFTLAYEWPMPYVGGCRSGLAGVTLTPVPAISLWAPACTAHSHSVLGSTSSQASSPPWYTRSVAKAIERMSARGADRLVAHAAR